jgi:hypothetical protein
MSRKGMARPWAGLTIGVDVGDRFSQIRALDADGEVVEETRVRTTPAALGQWFRSAAPSLVVLEAGAHSSWPTLGGCVSFTRATARATRWTPNLSLVSGGSILGCSALSNTEEQRLRPILPYFVVVMRSSGPERFSSTT